MDLNSIVRTLNNGLSGAQRDIRGFSYKVNGAVNSAENIYNAVKGFGHKVSPNVPKSISGEGSRHRLEAMQAREDPVLSVDWMGIVLDNGWEAINWAYIDAIQTPSFTIEAKPMFRGGTMYNYAGPVSIDSLSLTLYTDSDGKSLKFASSWMASVFNSRNGNYSKPTDYKKQIHVYLFDAARNTVCLMKFFGCFPTSWGSYSLDGSSGTTPLSTTMTLSVDSVSITQDPNQVSSFLSRSSETLGGKFPTVPKFPKIPDFRNLPTLPQLPTF